MVILVVGVVVIGIAAALLARTLAAAQSIDKKAQTISGGAGNIDVATNSVVQLNRTNELAASILQSAKPLQGLLNTADSAASAIDGVAKSINATAGTINGSAATINGTAQTINGSAKSINANVGTINGTAFAINSTAKGINARAAAILDVAQRIRVDASNINDAVSGTISIARNIKIDSGNIVNQAINAELTARCIDAKVRLNLINPPSPRC